jgi:glyoxylase-like metal-dependent hydrolase (beta-lactamase superfamily II)
VAAYFVKLISGERDAVLVDTPITVEQARAVANWVVASGKNLTTIYATHGHGDLSTFAPAQRDCGEQTCHLLY